METSRAYVTACHAEVWSSLLDLNEKPRGRGIKFWLSMYIQNTYERCGPGINYERQARKTTRDPDPRQSLQESSWRGTEVGCQNSRALQKQQGGGTSKKCNNKLESVKTKITSFLICLHLAIPVVFSCRGRKTRGFTAWQESGQEIADNCKHLLEDADYCIQFGRRRGIRMVALYQLNSATALPPAAKGAWRII